MTVKDYKVSIIIPIYNVEKYLSKCIDSIINQTYKNIEIILVNDGSPDNCESICREYAEKYNNIKYLYQQNQGVSVARNYGLENATGDFIWFMDSDDSINNFFIETSVNIAVKNDSDIVLVSQNVNKRKNIINTDLTATATWELFIKRSFLDNYPDIRFPINCPLREDSIFSHQLLCLTTKINLNREAIYYHTKRDDQATKTLEKNKQIVLELLPKWLNYLEDFYEKYNLWERRQYYINTFIADEIMYYYWRFKLNSKEKEKFFNCIKNFYISHNLNIRILYKNDFKTYMVKNFIECNTWQDFEKFLILRNVLRFLKHIFIRGLK